MPFVELGEKLANKIPRSNILPDSFLSDVHHPTNGLSSFQEISENYVLKLLHGLGPKKGGLTCYTMMHFGLSILSTARARDLSFPTWTLCRKRSAKQQYLKTATAYTFIVSLIVSIQKIK